MKTSITTAKGTPRTPETPILLNTVGGVFESFTKKTPPSRLQDTTQTEVSGILLDASRMLSPEETTQAKDQAREFQERMENFIGEVKRVREGFGYGYDGGDYMKRLSVSDEVIMEVFERILYENEELRESYEGVIGGFSGDKEKLKKRIIKEHGGDLVYEGMKEGEYSEVQHVRRLNLRGKNAMETKDMVVEFARNGGKWLDLGANGLDNFAGKPKLFKEVVVEYAKAGGKGFGLVGGSLLNEIFAGETELFKEMVVEFAKNGGKGLDLWNNGFNKLFTSEPYIFKDMVVEFARHGGKWLNLSFNGLNEIFAREPELFKEMVVEFAKNGGKGLDLSNNQVSSILNKTIEIEGSITKRTIREIIEETCRTYGVTIKYNG